MKWLITVASIVVTTLAFGAPIERMVASNYLFRPGGCSATLISQEYRWALTNYHCVEDAIRQVERDIVRPDGTVKRVKVIVYEEVTLSQPAYGRGAKVGELTLRAEILAFSKQKDLAVVRIMSETTKLPAAASIAPDDYHLIQGQTVYAVGNPAGFENTLSRGIVSHLYREHRWGPDEIAHYIQTDAAIAGGSSGGALYDENGFLIGVPSAGYRGAALNFAIPFTVFKVWLSEACFERAWNPTAPTRELCLKEKAKTEKE